MFGKKQQVEQVPIVYMSQRGVMDEDSDQLLIYATPDETPIGRARDIEFVGKASRFLKTTMQQGGN